MSSKPERYGDLTRDEMIEDSDEHAARRMSEELREISRKRRAAIAKTFHISVEDLGRMAKPKWVIRAVKEKLKHEKEKTS